MLHRREENGEERRIDSTKGITSSPLTFHVLLCPFPILLFLFVYEERFFTRAVLIETAADANEMNVQ